MKAAKKRKTVAKSPENVEEKQEASANGPDRTCCLL
jgi:hypothetical protein